MCRTASPRDGSAAAVATALARGHGRSPEITSEGEGQPLVFVGRPVAIGAGRAEGLDQRMYRAARRARGVDQQRRAGSNCTLLSCPQVYLAGRRDERARSRCHDHGRGFIGLGCWLEEARDRCRRFAQRPGADGANAVVNLAADSLRSSSTSSWQ